jgi:hypothetical protein
MAFKSPTQPLCRYCGQGIRKHTERHYVRTEKDRGGMPRDTKVVPERIRSKAECQKLTNEQVVSVQYSEDREYNPYSYESAVKDRYVSSFTTWDGESWEDEFFCNGQHAAYFGYASARAGQAMPAYMKARNARKVS